MQFKLDEQHRQISLVPSQQGLEQEVAQRPQHTKGSSGVNKSLIRFVVYIICPNISPEISLDENDTDSMGRNIGTGEGLDSVS